MQRSTTADRRRRSRVVPGRARRERLPSFPGSLAAVGLEARRGEALDGVVLGSANSHDSFAVATFATDERHGALFVAPKAEGHRLDVRAVDEGQPEEQFAVV